MNIFKCDHVAYQGVVVSGIDDRNATLRIQHFVHVDAAIVFLQIAQSLKLFMSCDSLIHGYVRNFKGSDHRGIRIAYVMNDAALFLF